MPQHSTDDVRVPQLGSVQRFTRWLRTRALGPGRPVLALPLASNATQIAFANFWASVLSPIKWEL